MNIIYLFDVKAPHIENWNRMQNVCFRQLNLYRYLFFVGEFVFFVGRLSLSDGPIFSHSLALFFPKEYGQAFQFIFFF